MLYPAAIFTGHLKFVDFGTAKDFIHTDLNGPEFVGTLLFVSILRFPLMLLFIIMLRLPIIVVCPKREFFVHKMVYF